MDFATMRCRVDAHEYKSFKEFEADFWLIVNNSQTYNADGSLYYNLAVRLGEKVWEWLLSALSVYQEYLYLVIKSKSLLNVTVWFAVLLSKPFYKIRDRDLGACSSICIKQSENNTN